MQVPLRSTKLNMDGCEWVQSKRIIAEVFGNDRLVRKHQVIWGTADTIWSYIFASGNVGVGQSVPHSPSTILNILRPVPLEGACWDIIPMASDCKMFRAQCQWSPLLPLSSITNWMSAMRMSQKCTFGIFLGFPEIRRLSQSPARKACDVIVGRYVWIEILRMKLFVNRGFWF